MTWVIDERAWRTPVRAPAAGTVDSAAAAELDLPELLPVLARSASGEPDRTARAWLTARPVGDREGTWRRWARAFDRTGLWPLLVHEFEGRPFRSGELDRSAGPALDAERVLREGWAGCTPVLPDGTALPHPPWPGLAPGRGSPDDRGVVLPHVLTDLPGSLLLVPARRPADSLATLGWYGACNWSKSGADVAAVLRSWEERFGAYVVSIGFATLDLVVTRPPVTARQCELMASEHLAFCPDNLEKTVLALPDYARELRGLEVWHFWWD